MLEEVTTAVPWGPWAGVALGILLLIAGRRLFWLVLAAAGFLTGLLFALEILDGEAAWLALALGLVAGLVAAGLAVFLPRLAVVVAGFLAGGYAGVWLAEQVTTAAVPEWLAFVAAGVVAALAARWLLDWALIAASSLLGAVLVLGAVELEAAPAVLALVALTAIGVLVQLRGLRRRS